MKRQTGKLTSMSDKAEAAFDQASRKVIQRARQSGTPVVVWKDGHIEELPVEQVEMATRKGQSNADNS